MPLEGERKKSFCKDRVILLDRHRFVLISDDPSMYNKANFGVH